MNAPNPKDESEFQKKSKKRQAAVFRSFAAVLLSLAWGVIGAGIASVVEPGVASFFGAYLGGMFLASPALVLMTFALLLVLGIMCVGAAYVVGDGLPWAELWYRGTIFFTTGTRVVFLVPMTLVFWLGLIAAFDVVWQHAPSREKAATARNTAVVSESGPAPGDIVDRGADTQRPPVSQPGAGRPTRSPAITPPVGTRTGVDSAKSTVAANRPSVEGDTTRITIKLRDENNRVIEAADSDSLLVTVQGDTVRSLKFIRNRGYFFAYAPWATGTDTVIVTVGGRQIASSPLILEVKTPPVRPLSQRQNLWFLPIGLLIAWMLLWPNEPEDKTKHGIREAQRDAWTNLMAEFDRSIREALPKTTQSALDNMTNAKVFANPKELENFEKALKEKDFSDELVTTVTEALAKRSVLQTDGELNAQVTALLDKFRKRL